MRRRQPLPRLWMMTDERQGAMLIATIRRLPRGAGIIFRHYSLPAPERRRLFDAVRIEARRRGLILVLAGDARLARAWRADGFHGRDAGHTGIHTAPVHDLREMAAARRAGAELLFISPVHPTRSHPGASTLGPVRALRLARATRLPAVALGGMNAARGRRLVAAGFHGWAAIDAWR